MSDSVIYRSGGRSVAMDSEDHRIARETPVDDVRDDYLSRDQFKALMAKIRDSYFAKRKTQKGDDVAFDLLCEGRDNQFGPDFFPLKHVVNALVRVSPKAKQMNARYFGGRFQ